MVRRFGSVRRRSVLAGLAGTGLFPKSLLAQGPRKSVGILVGQGSQAQGKWRVDAFRRGLMKYGCTDGQNIRVEYRWPEGDPIAAKQYAEELVAARADVLVATNTFAVNALRAATNSIPIVFVNVTDPIASGMVASRSPWRKHHRVHGHGPSHHRRVGRTPQDACPAVKYGSDGVYNPESAAPFVGGYRQPLEYAARKLDMVGRY